MHDELVIKFVNNTLKGFFDELRIILDYEKERKIEQSEILLDLRNVLSGIRGDGLVYDGKRYNAKYLMAKFQIFSDEHLGSVRDERFKRFFSLLPILSILEEGGIEALNKRINEIFLELKEKTHKMSPEEVDNRLNELDRILYSAIHLVPHLAKSVEVKLIPGRLVSAEESMRLYGCHCSDDRFNFDRMKGIVENPEIYTTLFIPLPYRWFVPTHGSDERMARAASNAEIFFTDISPKDDYRIKIPVVAVTIGKPVVYPDHTHFTFDEVECVKLSENGNFTPYYNDGIRGNESFEELEPRSNYILHYLLFRKFGNNYLSIRDAKELKNVPKEYWEKYARHIYTPGFGSGFWEETWRFGRKELLEKGFVSVMKADPAPIEVRDFLLLEFTEIPLPTGNNEIDAAKLFFAYIKGEKIVKKTVVYEGSEVIKKLFQTPTQENN